MPTPARAVLMFERTSPTDPNSTRSAQLGPPVAGGGSNSSDRFLALRGDGPAADFRKVDVSGCVVGSGGGAASGSASARS